MVPVSTVYLADYVPEAAETALIEQIGAGLWRDDLKRRVQHYGFRYDYKARRVTADSYLGPLPGWLSALADRLYAEGVFEVVPDQVIVNEYQPGQGIAAHVDCEPCFGDTVASLSLGSACMMEFTNVRSGEQLAHRLGQRSLLVLKGESRFGWRHGIPARKSDSVDGVPTQRGRRVSLTFRNVVRSD